MWLIRGFFFFSRQRDFGPECALVRVKMGGWGGVECASIPSEEPCHTRRCRDGWRSETDTAKIRE